MISKSQNKRLCAQRYGEHKWQKDDRVVTDDKGAGTVLGAEMWIDDEGRQRWLSRWAIKLDDTDKYPWYTDGIAYFWDRQLRKENEHDRKQPL